MREKHPDHIKVICGDFNYKYLTTSNLNINEDEGAHEFLSTTYGEGYELVNNRGEATHVYSGGNGLSTIDLVFSTHDENMEAEVKTDCTQNKTFHNGILLTIDLEINEVKIKEKVEIKIDHEDPEIIENFNNKFEEPYKKLKAYYEQQTGRKISEGDLKNGRVNFEIPLGKFMEDGNEKMEEAFKEFCKLEETVILELFENHGVKRVVKPKGKNRLSRNLRNLLDKKWKLMQQIIGANKRKLYFRDQLEHAKLGCNIIKRRRLQDNLAQSHTLYKELKGEMKKISEEIKQKSDLELKKIWRKKFGAIQMRGADVKEAWKLVKKIAKPTQDKPVQMKDEKGEIITDPKIISEAFSKHYQNVGCPPGERSQHYSNFPIDARHTRFLEQKGAEQQSKIIEQMIDYEHEYIGPGKLPYYFRDQIGKNGEKIQNENAKKWDEFNKKEYNAFFQMYELEAIIKDLKNEKAPGKNKVTHEILKMEAPNFKKFNYYYCTIYLGPSEGFWSLQGFLN